MELTDDARDAWCLKNKEESQKRSRELIRALSSRGTLKSLKFPRYGTDELLSAFPRHSSLEHLSFFVEDRLLRDTYAKVEFSSRFCNLRALQIGIGTIHNWEALLQVLARGDLPKLHTLKVTHLIDDQSRLCADLKAAVKTRGNREIWRQVAIQSMAFYQEIFGQVQSDKSLEEACVQVTGLSSRVVVNCASERTIQSLFTKLMVESRSSQVTLERARFLWNAVFAFDGSLLPILGAILSNAEHQIGSRATNYDVRRGTSLAGVMRFLLECEEWLCGLGWITDMGRAREKLEIFSLHCDIARLSPEELDDEARRWIKLIKSDFELDFARSSKFLRFLEIDSLVLGFKTIWSDIEWVARVEPADKLYDGDPLWAIVFMYDSGAQHLGDPFELLPTLLGLGIIHPRVRDKKGNDLVEAILSSSREWARWIEILLLYFKKEGMAAAHDRALDQCLQFIQEPRSWSRVPRHVSNLIFIDTIVDSTQTSNAPELWQPVFNGCLRRLAQMWLDSSYFRVLPDLFSALYQVKAFWRCRWPETPDHVFEVLGSLGGATFSDHLISDILRYSTVACASRRRELGLTGGPPLLP